MNKEKQIINLFSNKFIGDDGALVGDFVYSCDIFCENSHFKCGWLSMYEIGKKAMMVNISDAIVMNAKAKFAILALSLPKSLNFSQIKELKRGIDDACREFGIVIIGGDTICSEILNISVSIISKALKPKTIFRNNMKMGDYIAFTGKLGSSLKGYRALRNGGKIGKNSRFKNIILRDKFFYKSARFISSSMDISDGLRSDLLKFMKNKNIKFIRNLNYFEFNSGEEYEILLACSSKNRIRLINEAKKARIAITFFGKITKGRYKKYGKNEHF